MTGQPAPVPTWRNVDNTGAALVNGLLYTYVAGSTTPQATFTDSTLGVANTNPVQLNSRGEGSVWLDPTLTYKFVLTDLNGNVLWTQDQIPGGFLPFSQFTAAIIAALLASYTAGPILASYARTTAEIAASVTPTNYSYGPYNVLRYGADPTGVSASDTAFTRAIASATAAGNWSVYIPPGQYLINGTLTCHQGITFVGDCMGSTQQVGTTIVHAGTGDCFFWDGNGVAAEGTGGGIRNLLIVKQNAVSGGNAIHVVATDLTHRPSEFMFFNILIYALGTGQWSKGIFIDGSAVQTSGTAGVRDVGLFKIRVAGCSTNDQYIDIYWGVHVHGAYVEIDQGSGTGTPGMTIRGGASSGNPAGPVCLSSIEINGDIVVGDFASDVHLIGRCGSNFSQTNHTTALGSFTGTVGGTFSTVSPNFRINSYATDNFEAFVNATVSNVTGDGTVYTPIFNTKSYDQSGIYNTGTGIATVNLSGPYTVTAQAFVNGLTTSFTTMQFDIVQKNAGGTVVSVHSGSYNPGAIKNAANQAFIGKSCNLMCTNGDQIHIELTVSGSTKTVGIIGDAATRYSYLSMKYTP